MTASKRAFDLVFALALAILLVPVAMMIALVILLVDGRPVLFLSERMKTPDRAFVLVKFRTMTPAEADEGVSGGDKANRITRTGHLLRRTHLDEVPQLWNVIRGDLSLVGPRPPLRTYVEHFPALYAEVLRSRPGLTGLATLRYHAHEARLLAKSRSAAETDAIYCRACVPRKARLDLVYQRHRTLCLDLVLLAQTVLRGWR
ncbi:MAG: sugar transferase [Roseovarius sp.]|nr:sugar transferase [Roseovarius sp.]